MSLQIKNPSKKILERIDNILENFVETKLKPTPAYEAIGKGYAQAVFQRLQECREFKIGRTFIGGSIGKKTALGDEFNPDFDLVVFLNSTQPPFEHFLDTAGKIIEEWGSKNYGRHFVYGKPTPFSLKFEIGIYKFDLLPAANLVRGTNERSQRKNSLKKIESFPSPTGKRGGGLYSTSLAEFTVEFIRKQCPSKFIHDVIRLAKYWNKCVEIEKDVYIPGRSTIIELIAIHANIRKKKRHLLTGFKRFLIAMARLDTLEVIFTFSYKEISGGVLDRTQHPMIFDPVNPYNNIAHTLGKKRNAYLMGLFMGKAKETMNNFQKNSSVMSIESWIGVPYDNNAED